MRNPYWPEMATPSGRSQTPGHCPGGCLMNGAVDVPRPAHTRGLAATARALGMIVPALTPASAAREVGCWAGSSYVDCVAWQRSDVLLESCLRGVHPPWQRLTLHHHRYLLRCTPLIEVDPCQCGGGRPRGLDCYPWRLSRCLFSFLSMTSRIAWSPSGSICPRARAAKLRTSARRRARTVWSSCSTC